MFLYFQDSSIADEVAFRLENLGVPIETTCSCIKDHNMKECLDFGDPCRGGVYIDVPDIYGPVLNTIKAQVERGE